MILFGERHVHYVINEFVSHYNTERPHKGLDYNRPVESDIPLSREGPIECRERLGGLLKSYYRDAA